MAQLGIRFKPDEQQSQMGRQQSSKEGAQQAIQMLSLRYPKVLGASSPVGDPALLAGNGAPRLSGFNPNAAILQALIRAMSGGGSMVSAPMGSPSAPPSRGSSAMPRPTRAQTAPSFTPGIDTLGVPAPTGTVSKEWESPHQFHRTYDEMTEALSRPDTARLQNSGTSAASTSGGYRSSLMDKYDWQGSRRGNPFL